MLGIIARLSMTTKIISAIVIISAVWGGFELWKKTLRDEGAAKLSSKLKANDDKTRDAKVKNDAELRSITDESLINEFDPDRVPDE